VTDQTPRPPYDRAVTSKRWPTSVYGTGTEPDPRFSLANERTFLAWIRTSLALLAVAAAVDALPLGIGERAQSLLAAVLAVTGLLAAAHAWRGWARTERAMREDGEMPGNAAGIVVVLGVALAGAVLLVASVLRALG
jgi:putative membrane protein